MYGLGCMTVEQVYEYEVECISTGESDWVRQGAYGYGRECIGKGECVCV